MSESVARERRLLEDTLGATVGAAVGAGLAVAVAVALPVVLPLVPFGALGGTILGILVKEVERQQQKSTGKMAER